jgi:hypothetical protein
VALTPGPLSPGSQPRQVRSLQLSPSGRAAGRRTDFQLCGPQTQVRAWRVTLLPCDLHWRYRCLGHSTGTWQVFSKRLTPVGSCTLSVLIFVYCTPGVLVSPARSPGGHSCPMSYGSGDANLLAGVCSNLVWYRTGLRSVCSVISLNMEFSLGSALEPVQ